MSVQTLVRVRYPTSDGKPMAETPLHRQDMNYLIEALQELFPDELFIDVTGNILLYYEEGNPKRCVSPDVMLTTGIQKRARDVYLLWEEGKGPDLVIEVTSRSTRSKDMGKKKGLYEQVLKVQEYVLYDPRQEWIKEGLRAYRLVEGTYEPVEVSELGRWQCEVVPVELRLEDGRIRVVDPRTGRKVLRREELQTELQRLRAKMED
jgi:Uma2 family endonuclease